MRKLVYVGGAAACLVAAAFGGYLATYIGRTEPVSSFGWEEQEAPSVIQCPAGDLVYHTPSATEEPEFGVELNLQSPVTVNRGVSPEPIVVASPAPELPTVTEVGGAVTPGEGFGNGVVVVQSAPRPDEEPGQGPTMPYVADTNDQSWLAARLWAALYRVLTGDVPDAASAEETQEPPIAVTEPDMPPKPETPSLPFVQPTGMDYHYHQQCCPYTGRCPLPYHPAPPPGPGRE